VVAWFKISWWHAIKMFFVRVITISLTCLFVLRLPIEDEISCNFERFNLSLPILTLMHHSRNVKLKSAIITNN